jgi:hypothetical protein
MMSTREMSVAASAPPPVLCSDDSQAPIGEILLQGHAGTTHASPVDIREV